MIGDLAAAPAMINGYMGQKVALDRCWANRCGTSSHCDAPVVTDFGLCAACHQALTGRPA